jgi:hypothetical protein
MNVTRISEWNDMKRFKVTLLFYALLITVTILLHSQEPSNVHPSLTDQFVLDFGMYFPERGAKIRVHGTNAGIKLPHWVLIIRCSIISALA